jgi:hypothetical protein
MFSKQIFPVALAAAVLLSVGVLRIYGQESIGNQRDLRIQAILTGFDVLDEAMPPMEVDSNGDGRTDYLICTHIESGDKMMEALDYNHDGEMDDFYYYKNGVLVERAIDSNYDNKVDLWVYIEQGVYIACFEKDNDFDGTMDELKRYSESQKHE